MSSSRPSHGFSTPNIARPEFPEWLLQLCRTVRNLGGRALLVGGTVRDRLLDRPSKDFDLEVYGLAGERLRRVLESSGTVNAVGEHFVVYKFRPVESPREEADVSLPRRESKSGRGHRGFVIEGDPGMSFEEATRRRDFTVNALLLDPLTGEILDPQNGIRDLAEGRLRVVDPRTFVEDSLRVLRAAQFAARFGFEIEAQTVALCREIPLDDLPAERIWGEFEKILLRAPRPSVGMRALDDLGVIDRLFPELAALKGCLQEPDFHPEGDVWVHTLLCLDEGAGLISHLPRERQVAVMLGIVAHDLGKPPTTVRRGGRLRSTGHDEAGVPVTESFLDRLGMFTLNGFDVRKQVIALVREHLQPRTLMMARPAAPDGVFRRLAGRVDPDLLYRVAWADSMGRIPPARSCHYEEAFLKRMLDLGLQSGPPEPILMGRHVLELGIPPGPRVGEIVKAVYELQLDGQVTTLETARESAFEIARSRQTAKSN